MTSSLLLWSLLLATGGAENQEKTFAPPTGPGVEAAAMLEKLPAEATADELREAAVAAAELLAPQSPAAETLANLAASTDDAAQLRAKLNKVQDELAFQPLREAELPAGFPTFTPPGVIELKTYPVHRRAVANEFFALFGHITRNKIAMTAPVRMEYGHADDGKLKQESMAFYYGDPQTGSVGVDGDDDSVKTVEAGEQTVVALGQRGRWNRDVVAAGERRLRAWLEANPDYTAKGDVILMGYNSPMTPTARQFFEIQLPVEKAAGK
ncbi:MAG: heme-binding protein [Planctomycetaceae bacterium]|nr:heme-binding protein [Planctomycetaceae bacterium]